ncbi:porin family protein [Pseudochrobactrum sp. Wa41.01b-1]|nr:MULTISPECIES: outer membrane protein [unclassified Pseudochrobactrum]QYM72466.1 porin family protein [Pseudochrobactrum sp. Wa41.01b-1]UCA46172.1 porin family protein [Pseudochrobactrum sp. XF203]
MKKIVALLAMTVLSGQAFAADAIVSAPEPAPVEYSAFSWTGGYIGAHAGYGWGRSHDVNNPDAKEQKIKGGFGGLQAGYNWQFDNNVVLGAEADVSFGSVKKSWMGRDDNQYSPYYGTDKLGTNGTVRARLGYAADRFLPFVTGGLAWGNTKYNLGCDSTLVSVTVGKCWAGKGGQAFDSNNSKTVVGWTVGAGLEYAVTDNWTIKTEYLHKNFGKNNVNLTDPNLKAADLYKNDRNFKTYVNEVRIGVNYKF